jgi:inhibitor of KinA sporulation pathway (predicted exonuclease)
VYPFRKHWNIRKGFSTYLDTKEMFGVSRALENLNMEFEGTQHRGIDDSINIGRIVQKAMGCNWIDFFNEARNAKK